MEDGESADEGPRRRRRGGTENKTVEEDVPECVDESDSSLREDEVD